MASIVENITGDKALQLGNEEFVRKMAIGNNWNYLRIGCRLIVNGTSDIANPRFFLGLNNGDQNTFASSSCAGWIGVGPSLSAAASWVYTTTVYRYGQTASTLYMRYASKLNSTTVEATGGATTSCYLATAGNGPTIVYADIQRTSSSTYTVFWRYADITKAPLGSTFYDLLRCMEDETSANYATNFTTGTGGSGSITGMPSNFDTVSVYYNKSTPTIEISDLCVVRFY